MLLAVLIIVSLQLTIMVASGVFMLIQSIRGLPRALDADRLEHHELALAETAILLRQLGVRVERRGTSWRTTLPPEIEDDVDYADCLFEIVDHMLGLDLLDENSVYFDLLDGRRPADVLQLVRGGDDGTS